jgi:predicted outer membrane repeat protein
VATVLTGNKAVGWGANPASPGTPGGGSGGAIYTDGDHYNLTIDGTVISGNSAREGGGAIFFVVNAGGGTLLIEHSTLRRNPGGEFQNAPGIFDSVDGHDTPPTVIASSVS